MVHDKFHKCVQLHVNKLVYSPRTFNEPPVNLCLSFCRVGNANFKFTCNSEMEPTSVLVLNGGFGKEQMLSIRDICTL